LIRIAEFAN